MRSEIELSESLQVGDTIRVGRDLLQIRLAKKGCYGCALHPSLKTCKLKGLCAARFRPDKKRVAFANMVKPDNRNPKPFLLIKHYTDAINLIYGERQYSRYELITLDNIDPDNYGSPNSAYISDEEAAKLLASIPHTTAVRSHGIVHDFHGFREAFRKRKKIIESILNHGNKNALEKAV